MRERAPRQGHSAFTLVEVMIAASLMLVLLTAFYAVAEALKKSQVVSDSRLEARQNLRNCVRRANLFFSQANWMYTAPSATAVNVGSYSCVLPHLNASDPTKYDPGDSLVFAVPVDETHLTDPHLNPVDPADSNTSRADGPDGFCDNRYDVVLLTTRPLQPADSYNPNARQLLLVRWDSRKPPSGSEFLPVTIGLAGLGVPDSVKIFDAYLKPLNQDGFRTNVLLEDSTPAAALIHAEFSYVPQKANSAAQAETYDFVLNARNIF